MTFTFLHAADLHLDTPFTSVSGYPERVGEALREASLQAWDSLVDTAIERGVSFAQVIAELASREPAPLPYGGLIDDDPDLSLRVEELLARADI